MPEDGVYRYKFTFDVMMRTNLMDIAVLSGYQEHCIPLYFTSHFLHPPWHFHPPQRVLMVEAWEHNSQVLDQDSKHKVKLRNFMALSFILLRSI